MINKNTITISIVIILFGWAILDNGGFLKSNTKLKCKYNYSTKPFYIKIVERNYKNEAYEYDRPGFKKDFEVATFDVDVGENYWGLWKQDQMREYSKTREYINIRKSNSKIYHEQSRKVIGTCNKV